jgi:hypothetical protein
MTTLISGPASGALGIEASCEQSARPTLTIGTATPREDGEADIPIIFTPASSPVSALQFDVTLPPGASYTSTAAGSSAIAGEKTVTAKVLGGKIRVLVFGLNLTTLAQGPVASLRVKLVPGGRSQSSGSASLDGVVASDAGGNPIAIEIQADKQGSKPE